MPRRRRRKEGAKAKAQAKPRAEGRKEKAPRKSGAHGAHDPEGARRSCVPVKELNYEHAAAFQHLTSTPTPQEKKRLNSCDKLCFKLFIAEEKQKSAKHMSPEEVGDIPWTVIPFLGGHSKKHIIQSRRLPEPEIIGR